MRAIAGGALGLVTTVLAVGCGGATNEGSRSSSTQTATAVVQCPTYTRLPLVAVVGMTTEEFVRVHPGLERHQIRPATWLPSGVEAWTRGESLHGTDGDWTFHFERDRLRRYEYRALVAADAETFARFSDATRLMIAAYTRAYGTPTLTPGVEQYVPPTTSVGTVAGMERASDGAGGYRVLRATWDVGVSRLAVEMKAEPSKGDYDYALSIEVSARDEDAREQGPSGSPSPNVSPEFCFSWVHLADFSTDCFPTMAACAAARQRMRDGARDTTPCVEREAGSGSGTEPATESESYSSSQTP